MVIAHKHRAAIRPRIICWDIYMENWTPQMLWEIRPQKILPRSGWGQRGKAPFGVQLLTTRAVSYRAILEPGAQREN